MTPHAADFPGLQATRFGLAQVLAARGRGVEAQRFKLTFSGVDAL